MYNVSSIQFTTIRTEAQEYLFELECHNTAQVTDQIDSIVIRIYNTISETIYWFADLVDGSEFCTTDFNKAVNELAYAVVQ
jgi:hypothetical protein